MKEKLFKLLPKYTIIPLVILMLLNFAVYWGTKPINSGWYHYDLTIPLDDVIPVVPFFIVFYFLAYVQWVFGFIIIARENEETCYRVVSGELIAKLMCIVFLLAMPTMITRPEITGTGPFAFALRFLYKIDVPNHLFPSIHRLESWLCFRFAWNLKKPSKWYRWLMLFISLNVFASVVFLKQHFFVDIIAGIAVAELGQLISRITNSGRLLEKLNAAVFKTRNQES